MRKKKILIFIIILLGLTSSTIFSQSLPILKFSEKSPDSRPLNIKDKSSTIPEPEFYNLKAVPIYDIRILMTHASYEIMDRLFLYVNIGRLYDPTQFQSPNFMLQLGISYSLKLPLF